MTSLRFSGTLHYRDHWSDADRQLRVVLPVQARDRVNGKLNDLAFLIDTGSQWGIIPREVAEQFEITSIRKLDRKIVIAKAELLCELCEMQLVLGTADRELYIGAKLLVPDEDDWDWDGPNLLGLTSLQSFTWALEPKNLFHYRK